MAELHLLSPRGFRAAAVYAGIRGRKAPDVGLLVCDAAAAAAAVFTTNRVVAAPVKVAREHVASGRIRAIVVNAGNANACTGLHGELDARHMCVAAADALGCDARQVLPASTGIIGRMLPMTRLERGIRAAASRLGQTARHAAEFADCILTTDTRRKTASAQFRIGRATARIGGVAKGAGMIGPRMSANSSLVEALVPVHATMLAFLTSDVRIAPGALREALGAASDDSFNSVTIDDHMSTNDTAAIIASGVGGAEVKSRSDLRSFVAALGEVCRALARQIAADGEGATKIITVSISHAPSAPAARRIARAIASSPLVKCAMHGNDPNWGRIVSAAGYAGVPFDPDRATLALQGKIVFRHGQPMDFDPARVSRLLAAREVLVQLSCGNGRASATCWTCDLSKDYVKINADYHT
jgi:glutamate N-acetyltransferase/amino-acid N-acetyltransferase